MLDYFKLSTVLDNSDTLVMLASALLILATYICAEKCSASSRTRLPLPPGPRGWPIIGNLLDLRATTKAPWNLFQDWAHEYGESSIGSMIFRSGTNYAHQVM